MKHFSFCFFILFILIVGCTTVSFLPTKEGEIYDATESVEIYWEEPDSPYEIIGQLKAVSDWSQEEAFRHLKMKAREIGAHAIIIITSEEQMKMVGFPSYAGGTYISSYTAENIVAFAIRFKEK